METPPEDVPELLFRCTRFAFIQVKLVVVRGIRLIGGVVCNVGARRVGVYILMFIHSHAHIHVYMHQQQAIRGIFEEAGTTPQPLPSTSSRPSSSGGAVDEEVRPLLSVSEHS